MLAACSTTQVILAQTVESPVFWGLLLLIALLLGWWVARAARNRNEAEFLAGDQTPKLFLFERTLARPFVIRARSR
jgi:hypothetical protein